MFANFQVKNIEKSQVFHSCPLCEKSSPNILVMDCGHSCCSFCGDFLADNTETLSQEILFLCPFCKKPVKEISFCKNKENNE